MTAIGGALDRPRSAPDEWDPQAANEDLERLRRTVADLDSVVVAFSGGADSALLAAVCHQALGDRALAITAVSPSLAASELANCERLTSEWGMRWATVQTDEMQLAAYRRNDP
ncbi:MAG: hydrolase, partial [Ilumatobacteraceae bacterium]